MDVHTLTDAGKRIYAVVEPRGVARGMLGHIDVRIVGGGTWVR